MRKWNKKNIEDIIELTPIQEGILYHYLKVPGKSIYLEQLNLDVSGHIDSSLFEETWNTLIKSNEMLRTVFYWGKIEKPVQMVLKHHGICPVYHDLTGFDGEEQLKQLELIINQDRELIFDLGDVPFRLILCKTGETRYRMIISHHHILYDGWSTGIILKEFFDTYNKLYRHIPLKENTKVPFKEYIKWLHQMDGIEQKDFWKGYLKGLDPWGGLPLKKSKSVTESAFYPALLEVEIENETREKLNGFIRKEQITLASVMYGAWGILLQKYMDRDDVVFGTSISLRSNGPKGINNTVGMLIDTVPFRVQCRMSESVIALLHGLHSSIPMIELHGGSSLVAIKEYAGIRANEDLFDTLLVVENYPLEKNLTDGSLVLKIDSYSVFEMPHYDLSVGITPGEDGINIRYIYNADIYDDEIIKRMWGHFHRILEEIIEKGEMGINEIDMVTEEEKKELLLDFNSVSTSSIEYGEGVSIPHLFTEQVNRTPNHIAIKSGDIHLTYNELNYLSNVFAAGLQEKGMGPGTIGAIMLNRSEELIIGILGILKTGGAYLPINRDNPKERIDYLMKESGAKILVDTEIFEEIKNGRFENKTQAINLRGSQTSGMAYIIYTSGSTGNPKGVPITHGNLLPLLNWGHKVMGLSSLDKVVQNLSYYFDWSVWEIFITLTSGALLHMVRGEMLLDGERYIEFLKREHISVLHITPTHLKALLHGSAKLPTLSHLCIGAERLSYDLVVRSFEAVSDSCHIYNMYGPTEATIMSAVLEINKSNLSYYKELSSVPIGKRVGAASLCILDKSGYLCPVNVPGELYIGGPSVASGYLNNPELTEGCFIAFGDQEPFYKKVPGLPKIFDNTISSTKSFKGVQGGVFQKAHLNESDIFYKTGDRVRWLGNGEIEFLGRMDEQIKIRGFRIEPGEIEKHLLSHESISEGIVIAKEWIKGEKYLCAYVVLRQGSNEGILEHLGEYLSAFIPTYMIPSYFVKIERIPLNSNGKVDLKGLPEPKALSFKTYTAPRNNLERSLTEIWSKILGVDALKIGIDDDFFELGGHSLNVTALMGGIHKILKKEIPFMEIFTHPTIRELSEYINGKEEKSERDSLNIKRIEEKEYYELSPAQRRILILQQMDRESIMYNIYGVMRLEGKVDMERFTRAFNQLMIRHESLRTSFQLKEDQWVQFIHPQMEPCIEVHDIGFNYIENSSFSDVIKERIRPFDLSKAPLFRVGLIRENEEKSFLIFDMHHIISDGVSMGVLIGEFMALYEGKVLPLHAVRYIDYTEWFNNRLKRGELASQEEYWLKQFEGEIKVLELPLDFRRPKVQSFAGAHLCFEIDEKETVELKRVALEANTTLYSVIMGLFGILLSRLSGEEDIIIGSPVTGRKHTQTDLSSIVGMFVNTVALRYHPEGDKLFSTFLNEVSICNGGAIENQEYPFEELVEKVVKNRDMSRNPLFDVMFAMQNLDLPELELNGLTLSRYDYDDGIAKFDLVYICEPVGNKLKFWVEYSTDLFLKETVERFNSYFIRLIKELGEFKEKVLKDIEIISDQEKEEILFGFNSQRFEYSREKTLQRLFLEQVERTRENIGVVDTTGGKAISITYGELYDLSMNLAFCLHENGVQQGDIVGLKIHRSLEMLVGILGIVNAGCSYLPLNPKNPQERNDYMMKDSGAKIIVDTMFFEEVNKRRREEEKSVEYFRGVETGDIAYIIYTSGSTGKPKGVPITHGNISPLLHWGYDELGLNSNDKGLQNLAYHFDWSVWEIFIHLTTGASLYLASDEVLLNPDEAMGFMEEYSITVLHVTPTQYQHFLSSKIKPSSLRYLFLGAEKLTFDLVKRSFSSVDERCRVFNMYGPTEATIISAVLELYREDYDRYERLSSIPIGKGVSHFRLHVLNKYFCMCPVNVPGELYIDGDGVAAGYLNNPELTFEKFVAFGDQEPFYKKVPGLPKIFDNHLPITKSFKGVQGGVFQKATQHDQNIFYKTGDRVRWLSTGEIEFLGRLDEQVKIRGLRIELGEIVNLILAHKDIRDAEVLLKEAKNGEGYLCAYIVPEQEGLFKQEGDIEGLKLFLSRGLPDYMIPSSYALLDKMPLALGGKIDRKALPEPELEELENYRAARNETEKSLVKIWSDLLDIDNEKIGITHHFFQLGGHSLKATLLMARIEKEWGVKLSLIEIFNALTIEQLAKLILSKKKTKGVSFDYTIDEEYGDYLAKGYYPLSSAQKRLFLLHRMDEKSVVYNIYDVVRLEGELDKIRLEETLNKLIGRHESLRTSFHVLDEIPFQYVHSDVKFNIGFYNLKNEGDVNSIIGEYIRPFDLSQAPLFRFGIIEEEEGKYICIWDMHHIIADGMSGGIFIREFLKLYGGEELSPVGMQYKEFALWQNSKEQKEMRKEEEVYWLNEFKGEIPILTLPYDYERPVISDYKGQRLTFSLSEEQTTKFRDFLRVYDMTAFMGLTVVLNMLLSRLSGQEDIVIGTPVMGRPYADLENVMGVFINTLALRNTPSGEKPFGLFVEEVKQKVLKGMENQQYAFEDLVEKLRGSIRRDTGRNPLFDVMLLLQDKEWDIQEKNIYGLTVKGYEYEHKVSHFDLTFIVFMKQELQVLVEYRTGLFKSETIKRFFSYFQNLLNSIMEDSSQSLGNYDILGDDEKRLLLLDFNSNSGGFANDKTIDGLFKEQVARTPLNKALEGYKGEKERIVLTYKELDERSDKLGAYLQKLGVGENDRVGVLLERSVDLIISILGILKAGGGYVPLNRDNPKERNDFIMKDSGAKILVDENFLCSFNEQNDQIETNILHKTSKRKNLAYIIYTSGSTGKPKGVPITHCNLSPLLHWGYKELGIGAKDNVLENLSYYFDWSVWEIFITLTSGASLHIVPSELVMIKEFCMNYMRENNITVLHATPTQWQYLVGATKNDSNYMGGFETLDYLFIGAEKLTYALVERTFKSVKDTCRVFNMYGPTEATIISAVLEIERSNLHSYKSLSSIPIGKGVANTELLILDRYMNPVPLMVEGELYIGGDGIASGYLNNGVLSEGCFITFGDQKPFYKKVSGLPKIFDNTILSAESFKGVQGGVFQKATLHNNNIFYKTGDRVRWLENGEIEFLGRMDEQVKIRGFRIELGEIEKNILTYENVKDAVVISRSDGNGDLYLCCYFVPVIPFSKEGDYTTLLSDYLSEWIPGYMIPSYFVELESIPLNANGKVDIKGLPLPSEEGVKIRYTPARDELDMELIDIWSGILNIDKERIGIDDNFFQLGGHSLKAAQLAERIKNGLNIKLSLTEVFSAPVIRKMSDLINARGYESKDGVNIDKLNTIIERAPEMKGYPLFFAQQQMMILYLLDKESTAYNIPLVLKLEGKRDVQSMERAFKKLIERHEILRTSFSIENETAVQMIHGINEIEFYIEEMECKEGDIESKVHSFIKPFDLNRAPLFRVVLLKGGGYDFLVLDFHHIIADGLSMQVLVKDFKSLYEGLELPELRIQYKDWSYWQNRIRGMEEVARLEAFWLEEFKGEIPILDLYTDYMRRGVKQYKGKGLSFTIDEVSTERLKSLAKKEGITLFSLLLSLHHIFISKLSGQEDIVTGTPSGGREFSCLWDLIGMFVNTLAIRNFPVGTKTISTFLKETGEKVIRAFEHQGYGFEELVKKLNVKRDLWRNPLFDIMFSMDEGDLKGIRIGEMNLEPYTFSEEISKFDMTWNCVERANVLNFNIQYSTELFKEETITRMIGYFLEIVREVIEKSEMTELMLLSQVELMGEKEKEQVLFDFNATESFLRKDCSLTELFEEQVLHTGDEVAIVGEQIHLTYNELKKRVDELGLELKRNGVKRGDIVGVMIERSIDMVVGILSILKTGGGYLPISPKTPKGRVEYILKESACGLLITQRRFSDIIGNTCKLVYMDDQDEFKGLVHEEFERIEQGDVAYIIYTSGTTGKPKGVIVEHRNVVNVVTWFASSYGVSSGVHVLQTSEYTFDASVNQIFGTLLFGGTLFLISKELLLDIPALRTFIIENRINIINSVPTLLRELLVNEPRIKSLRVVISGAEKLDNTLKDKLLNIGYSLFNQYGPTEGTIDALASKCGAGDVNLGRPIANVQCFVLGKYGELLPPGIKGELIISGSGIARGYLNNPELTFEKFVAFGDQEPFYKKVPGLPKIFDNNLPLTKSFKGVQGGVFQKALMHNNNIFYKTGDLVRWLRNGEMEFLGRIDEQVKIRGYRIEPGEIEWLILKYEEVKDGVVMVREGHSGELYLAAYIVLHHGMEKKDEILEGLKGFLAKELPDYMMPSKFVVLESIGRTLNGKVDRNALPEPGEVSAESSFTGPRDNVEYELGIIWSELLGIEKEGVSIDADFFESGGHSLKGAQLVSRIHKRLNVKMPLKEVFKNTTIRGQATYIREFSEYTDKSGIGEEFALIPMGERREYYPLSPAQKRIYLLQQMEEKGTVYNMPSAAFLKGEPDRKRIVETFKKLILRHESLRTSFRLENETAVQVIQNWEKIEEVEFDLEYGEIGNRDVETLMGDFIRPFDLSKGPLFRVGLVKLNGNRGSGNSAEMMGDYLLMIDIHHIISDGFSRGILEKEFMALYGGEELEPLKLQYTDYACWLESEERQNGLRKMETYWMRGFTDEIKALDLPWDYPRPSIQSFEGRVLSFTIEKKEAEGLKMLAGREGVTVYMLFLSLFNIFLSKLGREEDIVVGTPIGGRNHADIENIIGMFVNTLALRNFPEGRKSFGDFLGEVKRTTLEAFENEDYPFEQLVEKVVKDRDMGRNPLFDVMFSYRNLEGGEVTIPGLTLIPYEFKSKTSKFDLNLDAYEIILPKGKMDEGTEGGVTFGFTFEYSTGLFKEETVVRFGNYWKTLISSVLKNKEQLLHELEIIPEMEKHKLIYSFNGLDDGVFCGVEREFTGKTIHSYFEEEVAKFPDACAVTGKWKSEVMTFSYGYLNERANILARYLREKGVRAETVVGILSKGSIEMIVGILGVLKGGGIYLPIDPGFPVERKQFMVEDSCCRLLLMGSDLIGENVENFHSIARGNMIDISVMNMETHCELNIPWINAPSDLAYILYTSGTTGKPKGVAVEHRNVTGYLDAFFSVVGISSKTVMLQQASFTFDTFIEEVFSVLFKGGRLVVGDREEIRDTHLLYNFIEKHGINTLDCSPLLLNQLDEYGYPSCLTTIISGGDALKGDHIGELPEGITLYNSYGPTETTVCATYYKLDNRKGEKISNNVPIGKPLQGYVITIRDEYGHLTPMGVRGEICISGVGLSRGYLNSPELTEGCFIAFGDQEPFYKKVPGLPKIFDNNEPLTKSFKGVQGGVFQKASLQYKSGDMGRWLEDGNIEFLGRMDNQVKVRGYRIELNEIERAILGYEGIKKCVVLVNKDVDNENFITAYMVRENEKEEGDLLELTDYLRRCLPEYMVPGGFVEVEEIPLTINGKLDAKALRKMGMGSRVLGGTIARDELEKQLALIWGEVLGVAKEERLKTGIDLNFFQNGGHSLKANVLAARIHGELGIRIPLVEIFKNATIRGIAQYIREKREIEQANFIKIEPAPTREHYPLSGAQKRLFVLHGMDESGVGYNMLSVVELRGKLDNERFERSILNLIQRHESLRTWFCVIGTEPVQKIIPAENFEWKQEERTGIVSDYDMRDFVNPILGENDSEMSLQNKRHIINSKVAEIIDGFRRPFDLSQGPLMRVGLIRMEEEGHILLLDMHHIISDGISAEVFIRDLGGLYNGDELLPLTLQYKDFAYWQTREEEKERIRKQGEFWLDLFKEEIPPMEWPADFTRPGLQQFNGRRLCFELNEMETKGLLDLAKKENVTLFMLLLSLYYIFLNKISGNDRIVVGTPVSGRRYWQLEEIMGVFINTLALVCHIGEGERFLSFLEEIKMGTINGFENQDYPFEELVEKLDVRRDTSRNALFDTMFTLHTIEGMGIDVKELTLKEYEYETNISKFDLTLLGSVKKGKLEFIFEYSTALFKEETIWRFGDYFKNVVRAVLNNETCFLNDISILPDEEREKILFTFNNTYKEYDEEKTWCDLFDTFVNRTGDNLALVGYSSRSGDIEHFTYRGLNDEGDRLVELLLERDIKKGDIIVSMVEHSVEMIIGILGILKVGGIYLPVDKSYPEDRVGYILRDSNAALLLTEKGSKIPDSYLGDVIYWDNGIRSDRSKSKESQDKLRKGFEIEHSANDAAYIIYTSGSTGKPKGVIVEHRALGNLCNWHNKTFQIEKRDHGSQYASSGFDASIWEIFPYLGVGASLFIIREELKLDIARLNEFFEQYDITVGFLPTQVCEQFMLERNRSLRILLTGGDKLKSFNEKGYTLYNNYGPTENTVVTTSCVIDGNSAGIPIGKPIDNNMVLILDKNYKQLKPVGVAGELCISGKSLARGYLNNPELTCDRFIAFGDQEPFYKKVPGLPKIFDNNEPLTKSFKGVQGGVFQKASLNDKNIFYKTGDLVRWLSNGEIEFLGRVDRQVKIRGFRIETGEIEWGLLRHEMICEALVRDWKSNDGDTYLCAYIKLKNDYKEIKEIEGLREFLGETLPGYMIPSVFIYLNEFPLTANGKVDTKNLPEPNLMNREEEYAAPVTELHQRLVDIWSRVLNCNAETLGIDSSFFRVGGHSLKGAILVSIMEKELGVKIPLTRIFSEGTIRQLAEYIEKATVKGHEGIGVAGEKEFYPLSAAQKRMYLQQQLDKSGTGYHIPMVLMLEGNVDRNKLKNIFLQLVERHESFRTSFHIKDGVPAQRIEKDVIFDVEYGEYEGEILEEYLHKKAPAFFERGFDLSKAPLLRVGLVKWCNKGYVLLVDMHHIISDGTSVGIMVKEFGALYNSGTLERLGVQYKDYSEWEGSDGFKKALKQQEEYWLKEFAEPAPVLELPTTFARPAVQSFEGNTFDFILGREETEILKGVIANQGTTLFVFIFSMFNILLARLTQQDEIVIGIPVAGRRHADLQNIIGMFINTLAIRNKIDLTMPAETFIGEVNKKTINGFENQDYPFDELVEKVYDSRDASRSPLVQVIFNWQNVDIPGLDMGEMKLKPVDYKRNISKVDLILNGMEEGDHLLFSMEYCTRLFDAETIERFAGCFLTIVSAVLEDPQKPMNSFGFISDRERQQVLYEFNATDREFPREKTITMLFEELVEKNRDNIVLTGLKRVPGYEMEWRNHVSYGEFNARTNRLARFLRGRGVKGGSVVGIMLERSVEQIEAAVSVLKAGATYVPVDSEYPTGRIAAMLSVSEAPILITQRALFEGKEIEIQDSSLDIIMPDELEEQISKERGENLEQLNGPHDLVFIIFTSGSTGQPKGAGVYQLGFVNLIYWWVTNHGLNWKDSSIVMSSFSFDLTQKVIFGSLLSGGKLIMPALSYFDPPGFSRDIEMESITWINCTPSMLFQLVDFCKGDELKRLNTLRYVCPGGEPLYLSKYLRWIHSEYFHAKFINTYGPTECADLCNTCLVEDPEKMLNEVVPLGPVVANVHVYILDKYNHPVPVGVSGELCIGGVSVGSGYLKNKELTAEKFLRLSVREDLPNERIYRTGDRCKWSKYGEALFIERIDHQVKIRGFRIEVGEIEKNLATHEAIRENVVIPREDKNKNKYLCAYYVGDRELSVKEFRGFMSKELPAYMIPAYFVRLETIPKTPNGKVDRKALPEPLEYITTGDTFTAAKTSTQEKLSKIWQEVLGIDKVGIHDNFFDIGGNSLLVVQALSRIHDAFPDKKIEVVDMFSYPAIADLSEFIDEGDGKVQKRLLPSNPVPLGLIKSVEGRTSEQFNTITLSARGVDMGGLIGRLSTMRRFEEVKPLDIHISLLLYLLSEITGMKEVSLQMEGNEKSYMSMEMDLRGISDFGVLFERVLAYGKGLPEGARYKEEDVNTIRPENERPGVIPLLWKSEQDGEREELRPFFDLGLSFREIKKDIGTEKISEMELTCVYKEDYLNEGVLMRLLEEYMRFLGILCSEKIETENE